MYMDKQTNIYSMHETHFIFIDQVSRFGLTPTVTTRDTVMIVVSVYLEIGEREHQVFYDKTSQRL